MLLLRLIIGLFIDVVTIELLLLIIIVIVLLGGGGLGHLVICVYYLSEW